MTKPNYWVYMLLCDNNAYYTGYTADLAARYHAHCNGTSMCKFTRSFKPIKMVQCWKVHGEKAVAMRLERYIKKLTRTAKEMLILKPDILSTIEKAAEVVSKQQRQYLLKK